MLATSLPLGTNLVTLTVTDPSGASDQATIVITVLDTTPPVIQALCVNPSVLTPPNHKLVPVTVSVTATDTCDPAPVAKITSITCNDTPAAGDIQITGNLTALLAASKAASGGERVYTLTVQSTDASGNHSCRTVTVTVPHSNGKT
jgi:hypothetical protein